MAVVQPYVGKATFEQFGAETKVIIPVRGKTGRLIFSIFIFAFSAFIVYQLFSSIPPEEWKEQGYLFLAAMGWVMIGTFATLLWNLLGKEIVTIASSTISVKKYLLGIRFSRTYDRSKVSDMRVSPEPQPGFWSSGMWRSGFTGGVIAFDYGAKTIRFGVGVDEAEAKQILEQLKSRNLI